MTSSLLVAIKNLQTLYWICKFVQPLDFVILNHMYSIACVCVTKDTRLFKIKFSMLKNNDYMYTIMFKWLPRRLSHHDMIIIHLTDTNILACVSVLHFGEKSVIVFLHVSFDNEIIIN